MTRTEKRMLVGTAGLVLALALGLWLYPRDSGRTPAVPGPGEPGPASVTAPEESPAPAAGEPAAGQPARIPTPGSSPGRIVEQTPRAAPSDAPRPNPAGAPGPSVSPAGRVDHKALEPQRTGNAGRRHLDRMAPPPGRIGFDRVLRTGVGNPGQNPAVRMIRPRGVTTGEPSPATPPTRDGGSVDSPAPAAR